MASWVFGKGVLGEEGERRDLAWDNVGDGLGVEGCLSCLL